LKLKPRGYRGTSREQLARMGDDSSSGTETSLRPIIEVVCHKIWFLSPQNEQAGIKEKQKKFQIRSKEKGSYLDFVTPLGRGFAMYG
jgi:hypothetical protein